MQVFLDVSRCDVHVRDRWPGPQDSRVYTHSFYVPYREGGGASARAKLRRARALPLELEIARPPIAQPAALYTLHYFLSPVMSKPSKSVIFRSLPNELNTESAARDARAAQSERTHADRR